MGKAKNISVCIVFLKRLDFLIRNVMEILH